MIATGAIATADVLSFGDPFSVSGNITISGSSLTTGRIRAGSGFATASRVELTATTGDIIVDSISTGNGGLEVNAAQRFQARDTFNVFVRITLDSSTDAELIDFLMRGDPQPLIDAGLVDPADFNDQIFITFPASIFVSPDGGPGEIVIRHGGQANTFTAPGITIQGSGALPDQQFVVGPNDDHTIDINPAIPTANFTGFTTLYPPGTFPADVNGTTGAILRGQGDATLVTSFQNQPFVPVPVTPGTGTPSTGGSSTGGGTPTTAPTFEFENATLENLSPDESEAVAEPVSETEAATLESSEAEACEAAIANRSANTVEIASTCPASDATDAAN